jgi:hypothetical protein
MVDDLIHEPTVRKFLELLHARAASALSHLRRPGVLQTVSISPDDRGMSYSAFAIGDVDRMAGQVLIDAKAGRNTYIETRTVGAGRPKERKSGRGKADATLGTFAIVVDSDGDRDRAAHIDGGATVVETSPGNQHLWLFLDRALDADIAERLGKLVRKSTGGDHCSGVVTQPFRIAGCPNFVDAKKRARGRVTAPTKLIAVSDKLWTSSEIEAVFSTAKTQTVKPQPTRKPAGALKAAALSPSARHRKKVAKAKISTKVNSKTDRSAAFQSAVSAGFRAGMTPDQIEAEMRANPDGPQQKYMSEGTDRLRAEINRSFEKIELQQAVEQAYRDARHAERVEAGKGIDGAKLLDRVYEFLGRFVAYPSKDARVAHVLWIAHTHLMECWDTTPRLTFLSLEPGSGKSRALELTEALALSPILVANVTPAYLFRRAAQEQVTLLVDEADTVFSVKSEGSEKIRAFLNASHRRGNSAGHCIGQGTNITPEDSPCFVAVALAALALSHMPETVMSRSIIIHMRRRAPTEIISPYRRRKHEPEGNALRDGLALWAAAVTDEIKQWLDGDAIDMPDGIADRDADVWEPMVLIADAAGDHWADTVRVAAVAHVTAYKETGTTASWGLRLLSDLRQVLGDSDSMFTAAILGELIKIEESPWGDIKGKPLSDRGLAERLRPYGIKSKNIRIGSVVNRGYSRGDFLDAWSRYLPPVSL